MSDNSTTQKTDNKSNFMKGRVYAVIIACLILIAEISYYLLFSPDSIHFEVEDGFFIPKFLLEPFSFIASFFGSINFYGISMPLLGLLIASLVFVFITLSLFIKNKGAKTILTVVGVIFAILHVLLMVGGIIGFDISMIVLFAALIIVSLDFPYKKVLTVFLLIIVWGYSAVMGVLNPFLLEKEVHSFYRTGGDETPEATLVLKFDTNVSGKIYIHNAVQTILDPNTNEIVKKEVPNDFKPFTVNFNEYSNVQIVNIKDLKPFTQYFYNVVAYSGQGESGYRYEKTTDTFYTPMSATDDKQAPFIVHRELYVQPLDIDFSDFIKNNYDKIVNNIKNGKGQYAIYLGQIWGIDEGETPKDKEKSYKFYNLLQTNSDKLLSIIPSKDAITKEVADDFMREIRNIIRSQTANPNLAEDLRIPAYIELAVKFNEPASGELSVSVRKNKDPLTVPEFTEKAYVWNAVFGLDEYQGTDDNKFDINKFTQSDVIMYLERKYSFSVKNEDEHGNIGNFTQKDEDGINTNITGKDYSNIINIVFISLIMLILLFVSLSKISSMKKKFMLKEALPGYLFSLGIVILIINLIASIFLKFYPMRFELFLMISMVFMLMSKQPAALKFTVTLAGSMVVISIIALLSQAFPYLKDSFIPAVDPNIPTSFKNVTHTPVVAFLFAYVVVFAVVTNTIVNNLIPDSKKPRTFAFIGILVLLIVTVVSGFLFVNAGVGAGEGFRNIAMICGAGVLGSLIGTLVIGDWGKSIGNILFVLLLLGSVILIVMNYVPLKIAMILLLGAFLMTSTPWARTFTFIYSFIQAFVLIITFIVLILEGNYDFLLKIELLILGAAYLALAIFASKSHKLRDYSEGKI